MCDLKSTPEEESAARYMRFVAHWCFRDPPMQELRGRFLKLAGADVVSGGVSIELITFTLLSESPWLHEAYQLN
jgi:hypothetical protein